MDYRELRGYKENMGKEKKESQLKILETNACLKLKRKRGVGEKVV
jgi:hypothetical protein